MKDGYYLPSIVFLVVIYFLLNISYIQTFELSEAEALIALYSTLPKISYPTTNGLVPWLFSVVISLVGDGEFSLRIIIALFNSLFLISFYYFQRKLFPYDHRKIAFWSTLFVTLSILTTWNAITNYELVITNFLLIWLCLNLFLACRYKKLIHIIMSFILTILLVNAGYFGGFLAVFVLLFFNIAYRRLKINFLKIILVTCLLLLISITYYNFNIGVFDFNHLTSNINYGIQNLNHFIFKQVFFTTIFGFLAIFLASIYFVKAKSEANVLFVYSLALFILVFSIFAGFLGINTQGINMHNSLFMILALRWLMIYKSNLTWSYYIRWISLGYGIITFTLLMIILMFKAIPFPDFQNPMQIFYGWKPAIYSALQFDKSKDDNFNYIFLENNDSFAKALWYTRKENLSVVSLDYNHLINRWLGNKLKLGSSGYLIIEDKGGISNSDSFDRALKKFESCNLSNTNSSRLAGNLLVRLHVFKCKNYKG